MARFVDPVWERRMNMAKTIYVWVATVWNQRSIFDFRIFATKAAAQRWADRQKGHAIVSDVSVLKMPVRGLSALLGRE